MGRRAKQSDPLGPRASRVEKAHAPRTELPSWYFRAMKLRLDKPAFYPENPCDFDEDLSELEEESEEGSEEESEEGDCECDSDSSECDCPFSDCPYKEHNSDSEDDESERSYDGSDAEYYYELKEEREDRKRKKKRETLLDRKEKDRQFGLERNKEEEVRAAEKSLKKVQRRRKKLATLPGPVKSLAGHEFRLFCSDHVNHFYNGSMYMAKHVEFVHPNDMPVDDDSDNSDEKSSDDAGMVYGMLFLDMNGGCEFGPFLPPDSATLRPMTVKSCDGKYKLSLHFLGDGYLKLRVSRDMVFEGWDCGSPAEPPPDAPAPKTFEFVGIWVDVEKEKAEREKVEMQRKTIEVERRRNRSPSPRETWFELNHPMGAYYYDPRYSDHW